MNCNNDNYSKRKRLLHTCVTMRNLKIYSATSALKHVKNNTKLNVEHRLRTPINNAPYFLAKNYQNINVVTYDVSL